MGGKNKNQPQLGGVGGLVAGQSVTPGYAPLTDPSNWINQDAGKVNELMATFRPTAPVPQPAPQPVPQAVPTSNVPESTQLPTQAQKAERVYGPTQRTQAYVPYEDQPKDQSGGQGNMGLSTYDAFLKAMSANQEKAANFYSGPVNNTQQLADALRQGGTQ